MKKSRKYIKLEDRHRIVKGEKQRLCTSCRKWKPFNLFSKKSVLSDGLGVYCKECASKQHVRKKQKIKDLCFEHYGGYVCAHCNTTDKEVLTLDHINNDGAKVKKELFSSKRVCKRYYRWLVAHDFPSEHRLQVLCWNCQRKKELKRIRKDVRKRRKNL